MSVTYENILKAQIGRDCKDYLADLIDTKSDYTYEFLEVMEVTLGKDLFMDRLYPFEINIGILDRNYTNPICVTVLGTIGVWGTNITVIKDPCNDSPLWFNSPDLNASWNIQSFDIKRVNA